jgi:hypothetical protein
MLGIVPNNMDLCGRMVEKLADRPPIFPVNAAVGISDKHDVNFRFINRKESMDHVARSCFLCEPEYDVLADTKFNHKRIRNIVANVDECIGIRKVFLDEFNVL